MKNIKKLICRLFGHSAWTFYDGECKKIVCVRCGKRELLAVPKGNK